MPRRPPCHEKFRIEYSPVLQRSVSIVCTTLLVRKRCSCNPCSLYCSLSFNSCLLPLSLSRLSLALSLSLSLIPTFVPFVTLRFHVLQRSVSMVCIALLADVAEAVGPAIKSLSLSYNSLADDLRAMDKRCGVID